MRLLAITAIILAAATVSLGITPTSDLPDLSGVTGANVDESNVLHVLHVSVDGDDSNPGTLGSPFRTVNKGAEAAANYQKILEGAKVIIHPGTYRETITALGNAHISPATTAPIILEANEPGTAILSASEVYTGWVRQGTSDIYTHSWTYNWGLFTIDWGTLPNYRQQKFLNNPILRRREMFFADGLSLTQVLTYDHYVPHDDPGVTELENSFYIDEDNDLVYIHLPSGSDISQMTIEGAERTYILEGSRLRKFVLRGLVFEHATNTLGISQSGATEGAVYLSECDDVLMEDNIFRWNNGTGFDLTKCEDVTLRRNTSNYNGFSGQLTLESHNFIIEDNEESYNNWRGARGDWKWDNSGRALGLFSGWTGTRHYRMHYAIIRRHKAIGNYARGIWFDYDNIHILYEDGLLHDNMHGLKFEVCPGPIWIKDTVMTDNALAAMYVAVADHVTIENCVITGNGHLTSSGEPLSQIVIDKDYTSHYVSAWDNLHYTAYIMDMERWTMFDTVIGGASDSLIVTPITDAFVYNQASDDNYWYHTSGTNVFQIYSTLYDFAGWKSYTREDASSVFASSAPVPSSCGDFGTTYPVADVDGDCSADLGDLAEIAKIWQTDGLCDDPLIASDEDLYHDCQIDMKDIVILFNNWLEDTNP